MFDGKIAFVTGRSHGIGAAIVRRIGATKAHVAINNAGVGRGGSDGFLKGAAENLYDGLFAVNVKGLHFVTQAARSRMKDGGRIVNIGSISGKVKSALREKPGWDEATAKYTPMGRLGEPEDIAGAVMMLLGDDARWVTGQVIEASGGLSL